MLRGIQHPARKGQPDPQPAPINQPAFSFDNLYPNMNNKQSGWETEKKKIAEKIKEITLIWRISYEDRIRLISMGITECDNPYLLNNFLIFL